MALKKLLYSSLIGPSIGLGPYAMAVSLPSSGPKMAQGENIGFGKRCLLEQEICDLISETEFKQDTEAYQKPKEPITNKVKQKFETDWENFIKQQNDDYCGFGFFGYSTSKSLPSSSQQPKVNVNNLETCYDELVKSQK